MSIIYGALVVAFAIFLSGLGVTIFLIPSLATQFLNAFASSARAHYIEQALRMSVGSALILFSPEMWKSELFHLFGWIVVGTTVGLTLVPWRWHRRFARWVVPPVISQMKLFGIGVFALAALLLYCVIRGSE